MEAILTEFIHMRWIVSLLAGCVLNFRNHITVVNKIGNSAKLYFPVARDLGSQTGTDRTQATRELATAQLSLTVPKMKW